MNKQQQKKYIYIEFCYCLREIIMGVWGFKLYQARPLECFYIIYFIYLQI